MPRQSLLTVSERESLLALPDNQEDLIRYYTLNEHDLSVINLHRGKANRLGFTIQLCYMRYPGIILGFGEEPFRPLLDMVARQLGIETDHWKDYGQREQTRREHLVELKSIFSFISFGPSNYPSAAQILDDIARGTDKGMILATALVEYFRSSKVLLPPIDTIENICATSVTRATRTMYESLTESLTMEHRQQLEALLSMHAESKISTLMWIRQSPAAYNARHMLEHIERLNTIKDLKLPKSGEKGPPKQAIKTL